jgi:hypothetical protein
MKTLDEILDIIGEGVITYSQIPNDYDGTRSSPIYFASFIYRKLLCTARSWDVESIILMYWGKE